MREFWPELVWRAALPISATGAGAGVLAGAGVSAGTPAEELAEEVMGTVAASREAEVGGVGRGAPAPRATGGLAKDGATGPTMAGAGPAVS